MLFWQIPFSVNSTKIFLIVQSLYNVTVENTSLNFDVCNKTAGGCESSRLTTSYTSIITGMPPESVDQTIIIVVTTLAGVIAVALILVGVLCRKRKRNQRAEKQKSNWMALCNIAILFCHYFVGNVCKTQTRVHSEITEFKTAARQIQWSSRWTQKLCSSLRQSKFFST